MPRLSRGKGSAVAIQWRAYGTDSFNMHNYFRTILNPPTSISGLVILVQSDAFFSPPLVIIIHAFFQFFLPLLNVGAMVSFLSYRHGRHII